MRALVLEHGITLQEDYPRPDRPELPPGEALVRVILAGICNTDLELVKGYAGFKGVPGHEFVGRVVACPTDPGWEGRRVVGEINVGCGVCPTCRAGRSHHCPTREVLGIRGRDGAFAEYLSLPVANLHAVPESVSDEEAVFVEPLAAALEIVEQVHVQPTDRVLVLGDGKLGQLIAQVLALTGCNLTVIGRHQEKLDLLAGRGIDTRLDGVAESADVVIEATGSPDGFAAALEWVRPRGKLVLKSTYHDRLTIDLSQVVVDEIQLLGSRCGPFEPALRLLAQALVQVRPLIQARFSLGEGGAAFEAARTKGVLKVLLET
jgi:threonine dehydrogenase-like Zn-dependent dehydrogenase